MRARVRKPLRLAGTTQGEPVLRAGDYARVLDDYDAAVAMLAQILPSSFVDSSFPGERQTKFDMLNGWQQPEPGSDFRTAYKRARWFLTRPENARFLRFRVRAADTSRVTGSLRVLVDGSPVANVSLGHEWCEASVSLSDIARGERFVCELHVVHPDADDDVAFDDYRFAVKDRQFVH